MFYIYVIFICLLLHITLLPPSIGHAHSNCQDHEECINIESCRISYKIESDKIISERKLCSTEVTGKNSKFSVFVCCPKIPIYSKCRSNEECIPFEQCPPLNDFYKSTRFKNQFLRERQCGYNTYCCPMLALPTCRPDEMCSKLSSCPAMLQIAKSKGQSEAKDELFKRRLCAIDPRASTTEERYYTCCPPKGDHLPNKKTCGRNVPSKRIAHGNEADLNMYPWMAMLMYKNLSSLNPNLVSICGGSLINNRYVLTAAHCVIKGRSVDRNLVLKRVRLGEHNTDTNPDCVGYWPDKICAAPYLEFDIIDMVVHEAYYNNTQFENDIALLRLEMPIRYTKEIQPICLMVDHIALRNKKLQVAGWGKTENQNSSPVLMKANIWENRYKCDNSFKHIYLRKSQICAGGQEYRDTCSGDSGGPLMANYNDGYTFNIYLAGITSYGYTNCGKSNSPSVYTKVGEFYQWIRSNLQP